MRSCIDPTTITVSSLTKLSAQGSACIEWHISRFAVYQISGLNVPGPIPGRTLRWVFGQMFSTPWNIAGVFLEDSLVTLLLFLILSKCKLGLPHIVILVTPAGSKAFVAKSSVPSTGSMKLLPTTQSASDTSKSASSNRRFDASVIAPLDSVVGKGIWEVRRCANYWNIFSSSMLQLDDAMAANQTPSGSEKALDRG